MAVSPQTLHLSSRLENRVQRMLEVGQSSNHLNALAFRSDRSSVRARADTKLASLIIALVLVLILFFLPYS